MSSLEERKEARRLFLNYYRVQPAPRAADEDPLFKSAQPIKIKYNGERVFARYWGEVGATVLCVHGVYGCGAQFAAFVPPLLDRGFRVAVFDVPGYGNSPAAFVTTDAAFAVMTKIASAVGPLSASVTYSMGGKWALHSVREGLAVERLACISSVAHGRFMFEKYIAMHGIAPEIATEMENMMEAIEGPDAWNRYSPLRAVESLDLPGLVLHGEDDVVVPLSEGQSLARAWRGAKFVPVPGRNHFDILGDAVVRKSVIEFVSGIS